MGFQWSLFSLFINFFNLMIKKQWLTWVRAPQILNHLQAGREKSFDSFVQMWRRKQRKCADRKPPLNLVAKIRGKLPSFNMTRIEIDVGRFDINKMRSNYGWLRKKWSPYSILYLARMTGERSCKIRRVIYWEAIPICDQWHYQRCIIEKKKTRTNSYIGWYCIVPSFVSNGARWRRFVL